MRPTSPFLPQSSRAIRIHVGHDFSGSYRRRWYTFHSLSLKQRFRVATFCRTFMLQINNSARAAESRLHHCLAVLLHSWGRGVRESRFLCISWAGGPAAPIYCSQKRSGTESCFTKTLYVCRAPVAEWLSHWLPTPRNASSSPPSCDILSGH